MNSSTEIKDRVDLGERLLVTGLMLVLVAESLVATAAMVRLAWLHVLLGIISVGVALYLANWVYSGNKTGRKLLLGWAALQVGLAALALLAFLIAREDEHVMRLFGIAAPTGATALGLALLKLVAYLFIGTLLLQFISVRDFLSVKAGEEPQPIDRPTIVPSGTVVAVNDKERKAIGDLGNWMSKAGMVLIAVGILALVVSLQGLTDDPLKATIYLVVGALVLGLGAVMQGPTALVRQLAAESLDLAFLVNAVGQLKALFTKQLAIFGGLAVLCLAAVVLKIMQKI